MKLVLCLALLLPATSVFALDCQANANDYCLHNCFMSDSIQNRGCDPNMVALQSGSSANPSSSEYRCYSPSTLNSDMTEYESGSCYCSRDAELTALMEECTSDKYPITTVFAAGMDNAACYRIPSIIMTPDGDLLAFAEQRVSSCGDNGSNNIVLRRREKGETEWGGILTVAEGNGEPYSNANPAIVYDADGEWSVLLHYDTMNNPSSSRLGKNMQTWSRDGGKSWEGLVEITDFFPSVSQGCMPGPSIGLQNNVEGHLFEHRIYMNCHSGNAGGNHILYWSDDFGESWQVGSQLGANFNECSIALLPASNSSVLMNCRTDEGDHPRAELLIAPDGTLAEDPFYPNGLDDAACQGSIIAREGNVVYQSNAVGPSRTHLTVKKSVDGGRTFDKGQLVWDGPAAYSMLVDGGSYVGLLFELGVEGAYASIGFAVVA